MNQFGSSNFVKENGMRSERGFTAIELGVSATILAILSVLVALMFNTFNKSLTSTTVEQLVSAKLLLARQMAITQRRGMSVTFQSPNSMTISGGQIIPTVIQTLPADYSYDIPSGAPAPPGIYLTNLKDKAVTFQGDGSVIDPNTLDPINGIIYLTHYSGSSLSSSIVTIEGSTGNIKTYQWNLGTNTWE